MNCSLAQNFVLPNFFGEKLWNLKRSTLKEWGTGEFLPEKKMSTKCQSKLWSIYSPLLSVLVHIPWCLLSVKRQGLLQHCSSAENTTTMRELVQCQTCTCTLIRFLPEQLKSFHQWHFTTRTILWGALIFTAMKIVFLTIQHMTYCLSTSSVGASSRQSRHPRCLHRDIYSGLLLEPTFSDNPPAQFRKKALDDKQKGTRTQLKTSSSLSCIPRNFFFLTFEVPYLSQKKVKVQQSNRRHCRQCWLVGRYFASQLLNFSSTCVLLVNVQAEILHHVHNMGLTAARIPHKSQHPIF